MRSLPFFPIWLWFFVVSASALPQVAGGVEPKVQILSPKEGSRIAQEENTILVSGKVVSPTARSENVDIIFVIDIAVSTAMYAGSVFGDQGSRPDNSGIGGLGRPQITIFGFGL